jgi:phage gp29-like protein
MATILGADGKPAWRDGKPLMAEVASIKRDIHRVFYGRTLRNEDDTLVTRGGNKGLRIYDELKRDAHAGAVLAKRKLAVTSRPWSVQPASESPEDMKAADLVEKALQHLRFNHICKRLLEATLKGYAVSEVMWELRDGMVLPAGIVARDPRRFVFGYEDELRLLTPEARLDGEPMPPRKFIVHRRGADDDNPYGAGIGGMLFWPVFFKRNTITFWLTFADKFGSPTPIGKYPNGTEQPDKDRLLEALAAIAQDTGVTVPEGMVIELLEAQRAGSVDTYEKLVRYMDEQVSKAVLGETMSTTAASTGLGSNQAGVQNDVRLEVAKDDGDELDETFNDTLVKWIVEYNLPGAQPPKLCHDFKEPEDLVKRAQRDKALNDMGWQPSEDYMLETYGEGWTKKPALPPPDPALLGLGGPGFALGGAPQQPPAKAASAAAAEDDAAFAEQPLQAARTFNAQRQQALAEGADALAGEWRKLVGPQVENLLSVLDETQDLPQFKERLANLLDAEPPKATVDAIARATFAAHVMGRGKAPAAKPAGFLQRLVQRARGGA